MKNIELDMTSGSLASKLIKYSLPIVASGLLQLFYNAADMVVVGKFAEEGSLAAVGATGALINLITNVFLGLSVGACAVVARHYGAKEYDRMSKAVHTSLVIAVITGIFVGILGYFVSRPLLGVMATPPEIIDRSAIYMKIFFVGIPANMIYNFGAAILRAVGDTKRPLIFLSIAGVINIILNLIFVIVFKMGVAGVATATIISQIVSAFLVVVCLFRSDGPYKVTFANLKIDKRELKAISAIGLPAGIQGSFFSISNVLIQSSINSFGYIAVEGNSAASNIEGFIYTAMNSITQAALAFTGQNYGAGKIKRTGKVLLYCVAIAGGIGLVMGALSYIARVPLLSIYLSTDEMIDYGCRRMTVIAFSYFICGIMDVMAGSIRGLGFSVTPMIVSIMGACVFRVVWIYTVFAAFPTLEVLYISYPVSWVLTASAHLICFCLAKKHRTREALKSGHFASSVVNSN